MMLSASTWSAPGGTPSLKYDEVHVWRTSLIPSRAGWELFWDSLSEDERQRARRYYFSRDLDRFVAARGALRGILASYLGTAPHRLRFRYGPHGKPALEDEQPAQALRFNLGHSGDLALIAVTCGREIGVDLEQVRPEVECLPIARRFFSAREVQTLMHLAAEEQVAAFYRCWTRKEAYLKAKGGGLSLPLDQFDVSLMPGETAGLLATRPDASEAARWSLCELEIDPGYAAALAVEGTGWSHKRWIWTESDRSPT